MRNLLSNAVLSFASIKSGIVPPGGSTAAVHERSLMGLQTLITHLLADVRLDTGMQNLEPIRVAEVIHEGISTYGGNSPGASGAECSAGGRDES